MTSKERLIHMLMLLRDHTDEEHQLSTAEIVAHFQKLGVPTDRKTVQADIRLMMECGIDIVENRGTQTKYFYADQRFELSELKLMIDAVEASKFITADKSIELVRKLTSMTDVHNAEELKRQLYTAGRVKPDNKRIFYVVDKIYHAINRERKISFQYYEYDINRQWVPRHGGKVYVFSPYAMLYNEDRYYVLGYSEEKGKIITFRVDRMGIPEILPDAVYPKPDGFDPVDYTVNVFRMYDGQSETVAFLCDNPMMNYIIEQFGNEIKTEIVDDGHFAAEACVSVSPTFFAWIFQFAGKIKIIRPEHVVQTYRDMLKQAEM